MFSFAFCTGIENSSPTIKGGTERVDELEKCKFYDYWRTDFGLVQELGIPFLRYGPPIHRTWARRRPLRLGLCRRDLRRSQGQEHLPIVDLCHFGVPDWIGNFQNPDFPELFATYARDFATRFPWIQLYTPVNEMFVCATFSARWGWWNEQLSSERSFVTALKHIVKANVCAMRSILQVRPDAIFIQSESSEYFHADSPAAIAQAEQFNTERFLSLDLNYGHDVDARTYRFLMENGMTPEEYSFFLSNRLRRHCILGTDYYQTNEHRVWADGNTTGSGEVFGYAEITRQYFDRYKLPVMHTETNLAEGPKGDEAVLWLWKEWANVLRLRNDGIPVVGFTWFSLTDQVDWDSALRENNGNVNALGLYDLDRNPRAVGRAYKTLISNWRNLLPTQSVCLALPVFLPSEQDDPVVMAQQEYARSLVRGSQPAGPAPGGKANPDAT